MEYPEGTFRLVSRRGNEQFAVGTYRHCEIAQVNEHPDAIMQVCVVLNADTRGWISLR